MKNVKRRHAPAGAVSPRQLRQRVFVQLTTPRHRSALRFDSFEFLKNVPKIHENGRGQRGSVIGDLHRIVGKLLILSHAAVYCRFSEDPQVFVEVKRCQVREY